jgi:hypothetical protein
MLLEADLTLSAPQSCLNNCLLQLAGGKDPRVLLFTWLVMSGYELVSSVALLEDER